ncbi:hypothetical protein WAE61_06305 [Comamonadaceae bacterium PP-2]
MNNALKILTAVAMAASLAACGGGGGDSDETVDGSNGSGGGGGGGGGTPPAELVTHQYYSRDSVVVRQVELDIDADSATVTLGNDTFTYTYDDATETLSASAGYSLIGGLKEDQPGVQVCQNNVSAHVVLPVDAQPATIDDLKGKTLTWYEDCTVSDGTGSNPLPSSVTFLSDGSLEVSTIGHPESDVIDAQGVTALLSSNGLIDESGSTRLHAYKVGDRPVVVFHQLTDQIIATWVYEPGI